MCTRSIRLAGLMLVALVVTTSGCLQEPFPVKIPPQMQLAEVGIQIRSDDGTVNLLDTNLQQTQLDAISWDCPLTPNTTNYTDALAWGARRVRVTYPGVSEPLSGVLAFCPIPGGVTGPGAQLYYLRVPQRYVDETQGGRRSVVYEPVSFHWNSGVGAPVRDWPAWILWLSRSPL